VWAWGLLIVTKLAGVWEGLECRERAEARMVKESWLSDVKSFGECSNDEGFWAFIYLR
jgi:hypothetical protein